MMQELIPGEPVVLRGRDEQGVVLRVSAGGMAEVSLPGGVRLISIADLERATSDAARRLIEGRFGSPEQYGLRLQSLYLQHAYRFDPKSGLSNARIEPQYHQVYDAWRVNQKLAPRMILADEVGLGKTIEAALIIKELRARGMADRVLVICPASLQVQWQQEMRTKFNESFEIIDGPAVKHLGRSGNPWRRYDSVITSVAFASHRSRVDAIVEADWDVVVVDEAHRVRRTREGRRTKTTQAYRLVEELKDLVNGLLLLTATPMQLDPFELYSLIDLVEPGLFPTYPVYESHRRELPALNTLLRDLLAWDTLSDDEIISLCGRHKDLLGRSVGEVDLLAALSDPLERNRIITSVAETHPLAEVMVRNRKSEVGGFVGREANAIAVDITDDELALYNDVTDYCRYQYGLAMRNQNRAVGFLMVTYQKMLASSAYAIMRSFERRVGKLRELQRTLSTRKPVTATV